MNFVTFYKDGRAFKSGFISDIGDEQVDEFISQFIPEDGFVVKGIMQSAQFVYWKDGEVLQRPSSTVQISSGGVVTGLNGAFETPMVYFSTPGDTEERKAELTEGLDLNTLEIGTKSGNTYRIDTWPEQDRYWFIS